MGACDGRPAPVLSALGVWFGDADRRDHVPSGVATRSRTTGTGATEPAPARIAGGPCHCCALAYGLRTGASPSGFTAPVVVVIQ